MADESYASFFLRTKQHRPAITDDHVERAQLHQTLDQITNYPLTLISAPAGYGKTTLVSAWSERSSVPSVWLSLDEGDNDLTLFLGYVLSTISSLHPKLGQNLMDFAQAAALPTLPEIASRFSNEVDRLDKPFALILDDYHVIHEPKIHAIVDTLMQHPPKGFHVVILTRHDPPLYLTRLRANNHLLEIRARDLRFSTAEVASFVSHFFPDEPSRQTVKVLEEKTEGWVVGLRLATIALSQWGVDEYEAPILQVENNYIIEYLVQEVLSRQPSAVNQFLFQTAILERFNLSLCSAVMDHPISEMALKDLERKGLFIEALDTQRNWYRYHQLFRQILLEHLDQVYPPEEIQGLHRRASQWLAENEFIEDAITHGLAAGALPETIQLLVDRSHSLMNRERWLFLESLLDKFPPEALHNDLNLITLQSWLSNAQFRLKQLAHLTQRVTKMLPTAEIPPESADFILGSHDAFLALLNNWETNFEVAIKHGQAALKRMPQEWIMERSYAFLHFLSSIYNLDGLQAAEEVFQGFQREQWINLETELVRSYSPICFIYWWAGDMQNLEQTAQHALKIAKSRELAESPTWYSHFVGLPAYQQNRLDEAEAAFKEVLTLSYVAHPVAIVQSTILLAKIYVHRGDSQKAWELTDWVVKYCRDMKFTGLLQTMNAYQAELAWQEGDRSRGRHWLAQAERLQLPDLMPFSFQPQLTQIRLWVAKDTAESRRNAFEALDAFCQIMNRMRNKPQLMEAMVLKAMLWEAEGDSASAERVLLEAVDLGRAGHFIRLFVDHGPRLQPILTRLPQQTIDTGYIYEILSAFPSAERTTPQPVASSDVLIEGLTNREMDVLRLMAKRLTNKEIAEELFISAATVKRHTINIYQKLSVNGRREAVATATELGILLSSPL